MPADEQNDNDLRVVEAAFAERVKDLFKTFSEAVYTGEPERDAVVRFRRGFLSAKRVRDLALEVAREAAKT